MRCLRVSGTVGASAARARVENSMAASSAGIRHKDESGLMGAIIGSAPPAAAPRQGYAAPARHRAAPYRTLHTDLPEAAVKRSPVRLALSAGLLLAGPAMAAQPNPPLAWASIDQLQQQMDAGALDSRTLARQFLDRIAQIDQAGPSLHAMIETNPDALTLAAALDAGRAKTRRGTLYGIPVLLKDNIDTGDRMLTTAGSLALADAPAPRDAGLVERLRKAGALVLRSEERRCRERVWR